MKIKTPLFNIKIDILFLIVMFIFLLSTKIRNFFSSFFICYLFIIFHESCHMLVGVLLGKSVDTFNISLFGVSVSFLKPHYEINADIIDKKTCMKNIFIYIAGPVSNFLLAGIFNNIKIVFDINIFLGILNLIPIYPLDGYNILNNLLIIIGKYDSQKIINIINYIFFVFLFILGILVLFLLYNPSLILFLIYLIIIKNTNIKYINKTKYYK